MHRYSWRWLLICFASALLVSAYELGVLIRGIA